MGERLRLPIAWVLEEPDDWPPPVLLGEAVRRLWRMAPDPVCPVVGVCGYRCCESCEVPR